MVDKGYNIYPATTSSKSTGDGTNHLTDVKYIYISSALFPLIQQELGNDSPIEAKESHDVELIQPYGQRQAEP